ncbi:hypothetical protein POL68_09810 [Stigmatella sp. ncwal1]|uniref:Uncharacterized protein n=1 Tax=Stigmatella ashevillensis TaxID=2995309 RepID=A0ABT5D516_9BACT|nr:hypothetical protein [Stigmatella ashevillena]MDC0708762.1 hypothetical protein [Stigmatella ashevillena]
MMEKGAVLLRHGFTFSERMEGAELELEALFHDHLAAVLRGTESRRSFYEFVTDLDTSGRFDGRYEKDVSNELNHRYSNRPRR